jgi:hypothetical protein
VDHGAGLEWALSLAAVLGGTVSIDCQIVAQSERKESKVSVCWNIRDGLQ